VIQFTVAFVKRKNGRTKLIPKQTIENNLFDVLSILLYLTAVLLTVAECLQQNNNQSEAI
jgi:hypothetical protein